MSFGENEMINENKKIPCER